MKALFLFLLSALLAVNITVGSFKYKLILNVLGNVCFCEDDTAVLKVLAAPPTFFIVTNFNMQNLFEFHKSVFTL